VGYRGEAYRGKNGKKDFSPVIKKALELVAGRKTGSSAALTAARR